MANDIQKVTAIEVTTSPTTFSNLNTISILNNSMNTLSITTDGGDNYITLNAGQTIALQASTGFVLPDVRLEGTSIQAEVIYT